MKIFPAIDIKDKKCVRLIKGDFNNKTEYETSPVDQAGKYKDHGFKNLHIVDLDGALTGETVNLDIIKESKIFKDIENKSHMYFVHSYEFIPEDKSVISATTDYSSNIVCSVEKENIFGTQFHPEKSDKLGLKIIKNFLNL
jgi:uncharacterized protein related to proFAR isomerase